MCKYVCWCVCVCVCVCECLFYEYLYCIGDQLETVSPALATACNALHDVAADLVIGTAAVTDVPLLWL